MLPATPVAPVAAAKRTPAPKGPAILKYINEKAQTMVQVKNTRTDAGHGLFTVRHVEAKEAVVYYGGRVVPNVNISKEDMEYGMTTNDGMQEWCILGRETAQKAKEDPAFLPGAASLANHRCVAPNCEFIEVIMGDGVMVFLRALEDIPPDTQITVFYSEEYKVKIGKKCVCEDCVKR